MVVVWSISVIVELFFTCAIPVNSRAIAAVSVREEQ